MKLFGALLTIAGVFLGLYVGLYICLYGGILDIISYVDNSDQSSSLLIFGIIKVWLFSLAGYLSGIVPVLIGKLAFHWGDM